MQLWVGWGRNVPNDACSNACSDCSVLSTNRLRVVHTAFGLRMVRIDVAMCERFVRRSDNGNVHFQLGVYFVGLPSDDACSNACPDCFMLGANELHRVRQSRELRMVRRVVDLCSRGGRRPADRSVRFGLGVGDVVVSNGSALAKHVHGDGQLLDLHRFVSLRLVPVFGVVCRG